MPLYDFHCPKCGATYEVKRPASRMSEPLLCVADQTPCERALSVPSFITKSNPVWGEPPAGGPAASGTWSHGGHTHGAGEGAHSHGLEEPL